MQRPSARERGHVHSPRLGHPQHEPTSCWEQLLCLGSCWEQLLCSSASGAAAPTPAGPDPPPTPPVSRPSSPPDPVQTGPAPRLYRKQTGGITGPFRRESLMLIPRTHKGLGRISRSHSKPLCTPAVWVEGAGPPCPPSRPLASRVGRLNSFAHVRDGFIIYN